MREMAQFLLKRFIEKAASWREAYGRKTLLFLGMAGVMALSFEGGFLVGLDRVDDPVVIRVPAPSPAAAPGETIGDMSRGETGGASSVQAVPVKSSGNANEASPVSLVSSGSAVPSNSSASGPTDSQACAFIGSRNSNKYHLPTCSWAKRIKPQNRVCFSSVRDAESKGYVAGCVK